MDLTSRRGMFAAAACGLVTVVAVVAAALNFAVLRAIEVMNTTPPSLLETFSTGWIAAIWACALGGFVISFSEEDETRGTVHAVIVTAAATFVLGFLALAAFIIFAKISRRF